MRALLFFSVLWAVAACSSEPMGPPLPDAPATVRDQLVDGGVGLAIAPDPAAGTITARQWRGHWEEGALTIAVAGGELALSADRDGALIVDELRVALAPIALPDAVFGEPARLTDLALELAADPAPARAAWDGPDAGSATVSATLRLVWSLETQGRVTPLGPVALRGLPLTLAVGGDATHVSAALGLRADGPVWAWAGLVELRDLTLTLAADPAR